MTQVLRRAVAAAVVALLPLGVAAAVVMELAPAAAPHAQPLPIVNGNDHHLACVADPWGGFCIY